MVSRGRTTATAGTSASRSPTTSTAATRTATTKAAPSKAAPSKAAPSKAAPSKPTTTRKTITQSAAGQAVQAQFKQAVSSAVASVGIDFGVPTVKTTIQETPTEIITVTEKPEVVEEIIEEPVIEETIAEEQINLSDDIIQILNDIENGVILVPDWFYNNIEWVKNGHNSEHEFRTAYNYLAEQGEIHAPMIEPIIEEPEIKETWWVIRPSGLIEQLTVTQKFIDTMTAQGWIFSKDKPTIEEPQNQNISIVFYIGKGGDLKTHFGINSIVVTPDEAELLAGWLYQHYNTKILFVMNRLTDDVRTHTLQQIKDLIIQKLKDDKPDSDDIDDDDIKKPQELGIMGAGIGGAIGILILLGFIADSGRKK